MTSLCIEGGGRERGVVHGRSTRSPESDPNARGRVRGIALFMFK